MKRYVIMLDDHVAGDPDNWPIVTCDETLEAARQRRQYQAVIRNPPRRRYSANRIEDKSLICTADGVTYKGAIYSVSC
jgi:hypothetical protein